MLKNTSTNKAIKWFYVFQFMRVLEIMTIKCWRKGIGLLVYWMPHSTSFLLSLRVTTLTFPGQIILLRKLYVNSMTQNFTCSATAEKLSVLFSWKNLANWFAIANFIFIESSWLLLGKRAN